jgi:hypothetical protein
LLLGGFAVVGVGGFFATKTASEAYLPMLFPIIILILADLFGRLTTDSRLQYAGYLLLGMLVSINVSSLLSQNYLMGIPRGGYGPTFVERMQVARTIVKEAGGNRYTIKGVGEGSQFASYTMNYEYLTWWLGNAPVKDEQKLQFIIDETPEKILLQKKIGPSKY